MSMPIDLRNKFPRIADIHSKKTSDRDDYYNCIAWAFKDNQRNWWPNHKQSYWPVNASNLTTMEAFEAWFTEDGWEETSEYELEVGYEKIALYALNGVPTHAARLLDNGTWTSKLGRYIDISHEATELEGPKYGQLHKVYRKPISPTS
jgi:hypothetical protein